MPRRSYSTENSTARRRAGPRIHLIGPRLGVQRFPILSIDQDHATAAGLRKDLRDGKDHLIAIGSLDEDVGRAKGARHLLLLRLRLDIRSYPGLLEHAAQEHTFVGGHLLGVRDLRPDADGVAFLLAILGIAMAAYLTVLR